MNRSTLAGACLALRLVGISSGGTTSRGDTTTLTVMSKNTLGHDAQVQWDATGGKLTTEDNGRIARVQFDKPGVYTVNAKLLIDGRVYDQDSVTIEARPLR